MAHIGQKCALGAVGILGRFLGPAQVLLDTPSLLDLVHEFPGAFGDPFLKLVAGLQDFVFGLDLQRDVGGGAAIAQEFAIAAETGLAG